MRIQNNITAMNTHRMYTANNNAISKSAEKLSSGYRINRAGDDAAGLAISEKMRSQIRGLNMASKNSQDANSLIQTAEGALQEVHSMLQRMGELANQSATGTNENFDRSQISAEFDQLKAEIDDISTQTNFNNMKLLDGTLASGAAKVKVDTTTAGASQMAVGKALVGATTGANTYTITGQTGLSSQKGTYGIADNGDGTIKVTFTDNETQNVTKTDIDLSKVVSGDFKNGGAFKVDLSAAGMGTFEMTVSAKVTGSVAVNADDLAEALAATTDSTATPPTLALTTVDKSRAEQTGLDDVANVIKDVAFAPKAGQTAGTYKIVSDGAGTLSLADADGNTIAGTNTVTVPTAGGADDTAVSVDLNFGEGYDFGTVTGKEDGTASTAALIGDAIGNMKITVDEGATVGGALKIQVGANEGEQLSISVEAMNVKGLGLTEAKISDQESAGKAITSTQKAINLVSEQRATLGAMQNRLEHKISNLDNTSENLSASESRIRDVDIAKEMTNFTKNQILSQASTAMLAQANSMPQNVLSLLQ